MKQELAELAISINMEAQKGRQQEQDFGKYVEFKKITKFPGPSLRYTGNVLHKVSCEDKNVYRGMPANHPKCACIQIV